jgi:hypothetical protein
MYTLALKCDLYKLRRVERERERRGGGGDKKGIILRHVG